MANFDIAIKTVLSHEGRYIDHKNDPGGATNFGISLRFLLSIGDLDKDSWPDGDINHDGHINVEDIKFLDEDSASELYRLYFWDENGYDRIHSDIIASKLLDLAVNIGNVGANKIAQRAIRSVTGLKLIEDGIFGERTVSCINMCDSKLTNSLLAAIKSEAAGYYRSIKYKGHEVFLRGWLNRAYSDPIIAMKSS